MLEETYILVSNKTRIDLARQIINDILPGFDGVITKEEKREIAIALGNLSKRYYEALDIGEEE